MDAERSYAADEIAFHAEAIFGGPQLDESVLIDPLFLGAVAACLISHHCADAARWVGANQQEVLRARERNDQTFPEIVEGVAGDMLRASWLDRFFHGISPGLPDPKSTFMANMAALEELSMSAVIDVRFAVQAFRDTPTNKRDMLLDRLAATSRREHRTARRQED